MTDLGPATAAQIAERVGMAYSTVTPKLRALAADGRAERVTEANVTRWRVTDQAAATQTDPVTAAAGEPDLPPAAPSASPNTHHDDTPAHDETASETAEEGIDTASRTDRPAPAADGAPTSTSGPTDRDGDDTPPGQPTGPRDTIPGDSDDTIDHPSPHDTADKPQQATSGSAEDDRPAGSVTTARADDAGHDGASGQRPRSASGSGRPRRAPGELTQAALDILQANPDTGYKVRQLSKLLDGASQGALSNALKKLADNGTISQTEPGFYRANPSHLNDQ